MTSEAILERMPAGLDGNPNPVVTPVRSSVLAEVSRLIGARKQPDAPLLVCIDGIDGAGKSTFADEAGARLASDGHQVVRSTIDSFHRERSARLRRGPRSGAGFYYDSHNLTALQTQLLGPFKAGSGEFVTAVFDEPLDEPVVQIPESVAPGMVLLFDGIFTQRPELADYWDFAVFLDGQKRVNLQRLGYVLDALPNEPLAGC